MNNDEFKVHVLNEVGISKAVAIAEVFDGALDALDDLIPSGRYMALVKTKMEEASFFAKKGMAIDPKNQK